MLPSIQLQLVSPRFSQDRLQVRQAGKQCSRLLVATYLLPIIQAARRQLPPIKLTRFIKLQLRRLVISDGVQNRGSSSQSYQTQPQQSQLQHNQQPQQSNNYQSQNPIKHGAAAVNPWSKTSSSASTHAAASTNFNNNQHSSTGEGDEQSSALDNFT